MAKTSARATYTRTKLIAATVDMPNQSGLSDANLRIAAITPGGPLQSGEVLATSPGAAGSITLSGADWVISGRVNVEVYTPWSASTAVSLGQRISPSALTNRLYFVNAAGTFGSTEPAWNATIGAETNSGTATLIAIDKFLHSGNCPIFATSTAYTKGQVVRPSAYPSHEYVVVVPGTSSGSPATFSASPTIGSTTVVSGDVTLRCMSAG
jgi:hypothetical protein